MIKNTKLKPEDDKQKWLDGSWVFYLTPMKRLGKERKVLHIGMPEGIEPEAISQLVGNIMMLVMGTDSTERN